MGLRDFGGGEPPRPPAAILFLFPGVGDPVELADFVRRCSADVQVISISYPDWPSIALQKITLARFIEPIVDRLRTAAVDGAVYLAGYSMGGQVAWAVASALAPGASRIRHVMLLDVEVNPTAMMPDVSWRQRWRRLAGAVARRETMQELGRLAASTVMRLDRPLVYRAVALFAASRRQFWQSLQATLQIRWRLRLLDTIIDRMADQPTPLAVPATLLRCVHREGGDMSADLGWRRYFDELRIADIPGTHSTVLHADNVAAVHATFITALKRAGLAHPPGVAIMHGRSHDRDIADLPARQPRGYDRRTAVLQQDRGALSGP